MGLEQQSIQGAADASGFPSLRSVVIGCIMCAVIGVAGPYWTIYLQTSRMFADYHTAGATFFLVFLFVIFNLGLGRVWKPLALRTDELTAIGAMMLVGGSIATSGLIAYFMPAISSVYYFATSANNWALDIWPHLPKSLSPLDPNGATIAIQKFWTGLPEGEPIPWGPWIGPLLTWGIFLMAIFACMMAIMTIMRKQWVDHEHLSFPIAQVPAELCAAAGPGQGSSIFRSKAFWIGMGVTFLMASIGGVAHYLGGEVFLRIRHWVVFAEDPWRLPIYADLVVVGLVFLIPNKIAFTIWFVALGSWLVRSLMKSYNLSMANEWIYGGEMNHLAMGATVTFVIASLWLSRGHLKRVLRCALGRGEAGYDRGEPSSYRTAFITIVLGLIVMLVWFGRMGLRFPYALVLVLVTLAIFFAMARVVAQCGLPMASPPIYPTNVMATAFGTGGLGSKQISVLGMHLGWHFDMRNSVMSGSGHGMYLARQRRSGLFWAMLAGLLITYVCAYFCTVWVCYRYGGVNMDGWFFNTYPKHVPWTWTKGAIVDHGGPSYARMIWAGAGALIMTGLFLAHHMFFWWPLHPVGMLICSSHMVYFFWFSVFLAWLIKVLLVAIGGPATFRPARRFFIGAVMGYFLAGGTWAIIDTITNSTGNAVFYI